MIFKIFVYVRYNKLVYQNAQVKWIVNPIWNSDCMMKILLLGNSGAGKSCLITRFVEDKFVTNFYNTIGVDFVIWWLI